MMENMISMALKLHRWILIFVVLQTYSTIRTVRLVITVAYLLPRFWLALLKSSNQFPCFSFSCTVLLSYSAFNKVNDDAYDKPENLHVSNKEC